MKAVLTLLFWLLCTSLPAGVHAQTSHLPWRGSPEAVLKIGVTQDGVHELTSAEAQAAGLPVPLANPQLRLFHDGRQVPFFLTPEGSVWFSANRPTGRDEAWVYRFPSDQSSSFFSLYADTSFYWLTWTPADEPALRFAPAPDVASPTSLTAVWDSVHVERDAIYYDGDGNDAEHPLYTRGEGFYDRQFRHTGTAPITHTLSLTLARLHRAVPTDSIRIRVRLNSITATRHRVVARVAGANAITYEASADWVGYAFRDLWLTLPVEAVPNNNVVAVNVTSENDFNANPNIVFLDYVSARYPRHLSMGSGETQRRIVLPNAGSHRLELQGWPLSARVFDAQRGEWQNVVSHNGQATALVQGPAVLDLVHTPRAVASVRRIEPTNPALPPNGEGADYVILTTPALLASAEALAQYRRAQNGFTVQIVLVGDVFDAFDGGKPTPLAIRRFVHATQSWARAPRYLVLWGDAYYPERWRQRPSWEVPSFGKASSDGWFAMGRNGANDLVEVLSVGRLPVRTNEEGLRFVQKVQRYEATPPADWMKDMIMLVGGYTPQEQSQLQNFSLSWSALAENPPSGMSATNFFKNALDPIDPTFRDSLRVSIRQGALWMCYFGHSSANSWEIVTDPPTQFNNASVLPVALSLGCRTGAFAGGSNVLADTPVLAEQLVLSSDQGAIAHWGSSGLGTVSGSALLGRFAHERAFGDTLRVVGDIFRTAKAQMARTHPGFVRDILQFGLIGDPATRMPFPSQPDLALNAASIRVAPDLPVPSDSLLDVRVSVQNLGLVPADSVTLRIALLSSSGARSEQSVRVAPIVRETTVAIPLPIDARFTGDNQLRVEVDPDAALPDGNRANNTVTVRQLIYDASLDAVWPQPFGLVSAATPRFTLALSQPPTGTEEVEVQLAPSPTFEGANVQSARIPPTDLYVSWEPQALTPNTVYYFRHRLHLAGEPGVWQQMAVMAVPQASSAGWALRDALLDEAERGMGLSRTPDGVWQMGPREVEVFFSSERGAGEFKGEFRVDGQRYESLGGGFGVLVLDGVSGAVRTSGSFPTYPHAIGVWPTPEQARTQLDALMASLREGDEVFVRTRHLGRSGGNATLPIPDDIKAHFRRLGSTQIDTLTYAHLWLFHAKVGAGVAQFERSVPSMLNVINEISSTATPVFTQPEGTLSTPVVGPALAWGMLSWETRDAVPNGQIEVEVRDAASGVLLERITTSGTNLGERLNAAQHPRVEMRVIVRDPTFRATPQLTVLRLDYLPTAEVGLSVIGTTLSADSLAENAPLTATATVLNPTPGPTGRVEVTFTLTDARNRSVRVATDTLSQIAALGQAVLSRAIPTRGAQGQNTVTVRVRSLDASDPIPYNNQLSRSVFVRRDGEAPVLALTFDGEAFPHMPEPVRNLQDPSFPILPAQPNIEIRLADQNPFLLVQDTSAMRISFAGRELRWTDSRLAFTPATADRNEAVVRFTPDLSGRDTTYTLRVRAFDASGNEASNSPYQVHFRVMQQLQAQPMLPYPNPMHTHTSFSFLLAGAEVSEMEEARLRIFTLTGQLVYEADFLRAPHLLRTGGLRIGWNHFRWDGQDADGSRLAPGVYLYRFSLRAQGERLDNGAVERIAIIR